MRTRTGRCKKTSKCIYATEIYGEKCCGYLLATGENSLKGDLIGEILRFSEI